MVKVQTRIFSINDSNINESYTNIQTKKSAVWIKYRHLEKEPPNSGASKRYLQNVLKFPKLLSHALSLLKTIKYELKNLKEDFSNT